MVNWTIVWNWFVEYFVVIIVLLVLVIYIIIKEIRKRKEKNKSKQGRIRVPKPSKKVQAPTPIQDDFRQSFQKDVYQESKLQDRTERDLIDNIKVMSGTLVKENENLDNAMVDEFNKLREELKKVNGRRIYIKKYGQELAKVYDKYTRREYQITQMMANLEKFILIAEKRRRQEPRQ